MSKLTIWKNNLFSFLRSGMHQVSGKTPGALVQKIKTPPPMWNRSGELNQIWEPLAKESTEVLGTVSEARQTVDDCRRIFSRIKLDYLKAPSGREYDCLTGIDRHLVAYHSASVSILGHVDRVSRIHGDKISLGYIIKKHPSGYALENLMAIDSGLCVLRLNGEIVAAYPLSVMRCESCRGITYC